MKTSANYRRVIVAFAERELRTFGGQLLNRTEASALLDRWVLREVLDDEERADVLSRFVAEPPSVPGLDWLPSAAEVASYNAAIAESLAAPAPVKAVRRG